MTNFLSYSDFISNSRQNLLRISYKIWRPETQLCPYRIKIIWMSPLFCSGVRHKKHDHLSMNIASIFNRSYKINRSSTGCPRKKSPLKLIYNWTKIRTSNIFPTRSFLHPSADFCSSQPSMVHWLSSPIFPFCSSVRPAMVTSDQISSFFNMYRHESLVLTQFYLIPSSTKLYWPSTTKYQPVPPHSDPAPPNTNQYCLLLTQYYYVSTSSPPYWVLLTQ